MSSGKRKIETIDLTNSSDNEFDDGPVPQRSKSTKPSVPSHSSPPFRAQSTYYPTPPTSSQPSSSQSRLSQANSNQRSGRAQIQVNGYQPDWIAPGGIPQAVRDTWQASTQEMEDDARREIDLTQDFDDDVYDNYELYGILNTKIVGCRFYDGRVTVGEYVTVRREPHNPYDRNAIRIDNVSAKQIGHIPKQVAAKLAGLMDSKALLVEGAITGQKGFYDCPAALKLFGTTDPIAAAALKRQMQDLRLPVTDHIRADAERKKKEKEIERRRKEAQKAAVSTKRLGGMQFDENGDPKYTNFAIPGMDGQSQSMEELLSNAQAYNPREVQDVVNKFASGEDVLARMKMAEQPSAMKMMLLPYQRQGLQWMLDQESPRLPAPGSPDPVQLWKNTNGAYTNIATSFSTKEAPNLASGGILADDMGLGKTIQVLSLIMADPNRTRQPTLIVAPLSVMSNWSTQAAAHVHKKYAPRVLIFHGPEVKDMGPKDFEEYDIVITTYQTMALSLYPHGKDKPEKVPTRKGLYSVKWRRIVLDEGHQIRNPKAKMSQAACAIMAGSRWVLTGTPIVNTLKDLYSHVKFIRLTGGLAEFEIFNGTLIRPLKNGDPAASVLLQALMATVCLRRMKDMKFIDLKLPEMTSLKYPVKFLPHEQEKYDAFKAEAQGVLEQAKARKGQATYSHLLEVLMRMRQACNHWKMCGEDRVNKVLELLEENKAIDVMDPANRLALQDLLQIRIDAQEDCPVCIDTMTNPVITACAHLSAQIALRKLSMSSTSAPCVALSSWTMAP